MPIGRGVRKHHATTAPVAGGVRPGAQRRIAHTVLLGQGRGMPLLQVSCPTVAPGKAAWNAASCWARSGRAGARRTVGWWERGLARLERCGKWRWPLVPLWDALPAGGGGRPAAWRCCSSRHCARAVSM